MRVLLVHMPWGALERPALGLSLLEAGLLERGFDCRTLYLNMRLAERIGSATYNWITHDLPHVAFAGEWLFTEALHGADAERDRGYLRRVLRDTWQLDDAMLARLRAARLQVEPFLAEALAAVDWGAVDVVGFTSTFEQNLASLALARRIKLKYPRVMTAFGGANWEGPMGQAYHRAFPFVDLAFSGEADVSFPRVLQELKQHPRAGTSRTDALRRIDGVVFRDHHGGSVATGPAEPVESMDTLPIPSYEPYFQARAGSPAAQEVAPVLLFEASRGCWWGAKSHCTFCGLNGHSMGYRSKSPGRLLKELSQLFEQWPCPSVEAVDNILDMGYFDTVLPALERLAPPGPVFFEVKANLKRHHVAQLARSKVMRIQPGIESLSDGILALMRKGTTALRNVQLLKWCREYGVAADWNLLYGFPGETDEDYDAMHALLPLIGHLQAPGACGSIRLDRFSPYFSAPASFGLSKVRALPVYQYLYPHGLLDVNQVAYYFEFDYGPDVQPAHRARDVVALANAWRDAGDNGTLQAMPHVDGGLVMRDTRACARAATQRFDARERCVLERIDEIASVAQVRRALQARFAEDRFEDASVEVFLDHLVEIGLALKRGDGEVPRYLGLALMSLPLRPALEAASRRQGGIAAIPVSTTTPAAVAA